MNFFYFDNYWNEVLFSNWGERLKLNSLSKLSILYLVLYLTFSGKSLTMTLLDLRVWRGRWYDEVEKERARKKKNWRRIFFLINKNKIIWKRFKYVLNNFLLLKILSKGISWK